MLADPPAPVIDFIPVRRVEDGRPVVAELMVQLQPAYVMLPPVLSIAGGWVTDPNGGQDFAFYDRYEVREEAGGGGVRRFRLRRDPRKVLLAPPGADRRPEYEVTVAAGGGWCDCRGFVYCEAEPRTCKHCECLSHLVKTGAL